jgi:hypothetical protein
MMQLVIVILYKIASVAAVTFIHVLCALRLPPWSHCAPSWYPRFSVIVTLDMVSQAGYSRSRYRIWE